MANYGGGAGGRTGPYWRRQTGTTLPGERTGAELNAINSLRKKAGQAPLGGPRSASPSSATYRSSLFAPTPLKRAVKTTPVLSNLARTVASQTHVNKGDLRAALKRTSRRAIFNG